MGADNESAAQLKGDSVELPVIQTRLALDRTLLAWMRTALTLYGFGFALAKYVREMAVRGALPELPQGYPRVIGMTLMGVALLTLIGGAFEYGTFSKRVRPDKSIWSVSLVVTAFLAVLGVFLTVSLLKELYGG